MSVDDDNFLAGENYVGMHGVLGKETELKVKTSPSGWLNICEFLTEKNALLK